jgi:hypothetical protein
MPILWGLRMADEEIELNPDESTIELHDASNDDLIELNPDESTIEL